MKNGNRNKREESRELIIKTETERKGSEEGGKRHRRENENSSKFDLERRANNYL